MDSNSSRGLCGLCGTAMVLVIIGALNWGLVGIGGFADSNWNVVNLLLGGYPTIEWIVYILVGIAGLWSILSWSKCCMSNCSRPMNKGM